MNIKNQILKIKNLILKYDAKKFLTFRFGCGIIVLKKEDVESNDGIFKGVMLFIIALKRQFTKQIAFIATTITTIF